MSKLFGSKNSEFEIKTLELHNAYRREHGAPPLVLSKELSKISQAWAEELAKKDDMAYSNNKKYGESVFCGWTKTSDTKITAQDCVDKWYSEINEYSFGKEPKVLKCGHFTQIVWKNTKQLGVGRAKSKSGKVYVVANYYPPGNYAGQFADNVPPPGALQFESSSSSVLQDSSSGSNLPSEAYSLEDYEDADLGMSQKLMKVRIEHDIQMFEDEFLATHNNYRLLHGVPPLMLNKEINVYAKDWANKLAEKNIMEHRDQDTYGENVFYAWSNDPNFVVYGNEPVDKWYSEISDFKFGQEPTDLKAGHFTQVIWKSCKEVGVALTKSSTGKIYVVANYFPPGNILGQFAENVPPRTKTLVI